MTRRGSTPFLQRVFTSELVVSASKSGMVPEWEELERKATTGDTWEDWRVCFGVLRDEGYDRLRLAVTSIGDTGLDDYLSSGADALEFGLGVMSTSNRRRSFEKGNVSVQPGKKSVVTCVLDLVLAELRGEVLLEPMILAVRDLPGPKNWIGVTRGTIVGTSNIIRLREITDAGALGDIFEFKWLSFKATDNLNTGELFDIDLSDAGERPVLYLNEDIENFHHLMNVKDPAMGKPSAKVKSRRTIDASLAVQVMTETLSAVAHRIADLASQEKLDNPDGPDLRSIFDELSPHEQVIAAAWRHLLGATSEPEDGPSVCAEIGAMDSSALSKHLYSVMPRRVRSEAGMETAAQHIIAGGLKPESVEVDA